MKNMKNMKKRLISLAMVVVMVLTTFLPSVGTLTAEAATTAEDQMIVTSPWAYQYGTTVNDETQTAEGYEYVTTITGSKNYKSYDYPALMKDVDLSVYSEFRFSVKIALGTTYNKYYVKRVDAASFENDYLIKIEDETEWTEFVFKCEDDGTGAKKFHMYKAGTPTDIWLPSDMNLSDLQMRGSYDSTATLYMTELRGSLKEGAQIPLEVVADSFNTLTGETVTTEKPNAVATKSTKVATSWSSTRNPLTDEDLSKYDKILFYAKKAGDGSGSFESDYLSTFVIDYTWLEFKLVRNDDNTWNIYTGGVLKSENLEIDNLSDITATYGQNNYYFSEVFGVSPKEDETSELLGDMIVTSPWAYQYGTTVNDETQTAEGYECVTTITGSKNYKSYDNPALMKDVDLSVYSEFRFSVKIALGTTYNKYYVKRVDAASFENDYLIKIEDETEWTEFVFKCEDDGMGTKKFRMYKAGTPTDIWLPSDMNLSDLQMRGSYDSTATLYMTELRGTLKEGAQIPLEIVADSFNTLTGETVTTEKPNAVATKSTKVATSWSSTRNPLTDEDLSKYDKILFYAKKAGDGGGSFESDYLSTFVIDYTWLEFKLVRNDDNTWNIYTGGVLKSENLEIDNLSDITATYGQNNYYFSEVFAVVHEEEIDYEINPDAVGLVRTLKASAAYKEDQTTYKEKYDFLQNDVINWQDVQWLRQEIVGAEHEFMAAISPWAYYIADMDNSYAYSEAGYQYATLVTGSYFGKDASYVTTREGALLSDIELSIYEEFRFALKTNGDFYYEICHEEDNWNDGTTDSNVIAGNNTEWQEWIFKREIDGTGVVKFRLYQGEGEENAKNVWLSTDSNLSDLKMRFASANKDNATDGILYMTEVRGVVKDDATLPLEILADNFSTITSETESEEEVAIIDAIKSKKVNPSWGVRALNSVALDGYDKILFYMRGTENNSGYFQSDILLSPAIDGTEQGLVLKKAWIEFKLVRTSENLWNVYMGGILREENVELSNLSSITMNFGANGEYYVSEVFAVPTAEPIVLLNDDLTTEYSVVYKDSNNEFAATEFQTYMEDAIADEATDATGVTYEIEQVDTIPENDAKNIVIGEDLASLAELQSTALTTDNGYAITRKGDNLYVYGNTTQGTLNGVYELLKKAVGLEIYTDEVATDTYETEDGAITLNDVDEVVNPTIDYVYDMNRETRDNGAYRKKLGFTLDWNHLGGSDHEETKFMAAKKSDGTSYYSGTASNGHIDLTNVTTQQEVAQYLYDTYVENSSLSDIRFGLADDTNWFDNTEVGAKRTAQYVTFMNAVATKLQALMDEEDGVKRNINLILLAYLNTVIAPEDVALVTGLENITLQVAYAPIEANWYVPLTDGENDKVPSEVDSDVIYDADDELKKWVELAKAGNVLLWTYHAFPGNYLTPFDSLNALQKNYALAAYYGVPAVYDIAQYATEKTLPSDGTDDEPTDKSTDWTRLKVYLSNELAKKPTMTEIEYNQLIENFMNAYFGVAADAMMSALETERTLMKEVYENVKTMKYGWFDANSISFEYRYGARGGYHTLVDEESTGWLSDPAEIRNTAWGWTDTSEAHPMMEVCTEMGNAYEAVGTALTNGTITEAEAQTLKERVQLEAISIRYILLRVAGVYVNSDFESTSVEDTDVDSAYQSLIDDCEALGITVLGEGSKRDLTVENLQKDDL